MPERRSNNSEPFSPEQIAKIKELIAASPLSALQRKQIKALLAKPKPKDFRIFSGSSHVELSK